MPLTKYGAHFPYAREALLALFPYAQKWHVEQGGRYDARGGVLHVWSHPWSTQALRDASTLVGSFSVNWLTEHLVHIEWDAGFGLADMLHALAVLEEEALGAVKHGRFRTGWSQRQALPRPCRGIFPPPLSCTPLRSAPRGSAATASASRDKPAPLLLSEVMGSPHYPAVCSGVRA